MEAEFRAPKKDLRLGVVLFVFFVLALVGSIAYGVPDAPPDRQHLLLLFVGVVWGFAIGLSLWMILAYFRERLTISDGTIIQQGVIRRREWQIEDVTAVRWRGNPKGSSIVLRTRFEKMVIQLPNIDGDQKLSLIRHLRERIPESMQSGWPQFCHLVAIRLRDYDPDRPPNPDDIVVTRSKWAWYFVPAIVVSVIIGGVVWWKLQQPALIVIGPVKLVILWAFVAWTTPRKGMNCGRVGVDRDAKRFLYSILGWSLVLLIGTILFRQFPAQIPRATVIGWTCLGFWTAGFAYFIYKTDRRMAARLRDKSKAAAHKWEAGERRPDLDLPAA